MRFFTRLFIRLIHRGATISTVAASCLLGFSALCQAQAARDDTHIVFLAGPKDHGFPGRHDYELDLKVLEQAFLAAPNLDGVRTSFYLGKAPDAADIPDADVIVILSSSDRAGNETHPLFPPDPDTNGRNWNDNPEALALIEGYDALVAQGMGVVVLHYAVWAENWAARQRYIDWTGGLWVQMASKNPVDTWTMTPVNITHPVLNGVQEWTYRDEVFTRFWLPPDHRRTDLIMATPRDDRNGIGTNVAAWAYQRDDGGRGFVFGGVDYHDAMLLEDYRQLMLNGIWWAAGGMVPPEGITSETPAGIEPYVAPEFSPRR